LKTIKIHGDNVKQHLTALDGFRACLALWVYFGHLAYAVGFQNRLLSMHPLAVDLFMVLSGFLMVYTWKAREEQNQRASNNILAFYAGRFFRIAPLYYFLLIVSGFVLTSLASMHDVILKTFPPPWITGGEDYSPHTAWSFSNLKWFLLHVTFLYGLVPGMEASTPLPDWSLSLEMQFYLMFPFLLILFRKTPWILIALFAAILAYFSPRLFGNYLDAGFLSHFGQPSLIAYRLNAFLAGMVVAYWLKERHGVVAIKPRRQLYLGLTALICILPMTKLVILLFVMFVLLAAGRAPILTKLFSIKPLRYLGDISYSIYLCHLLILTPTIYWLITHTSFVSFSPMMRFVVAVLVTCPLVILTSSLLYWFIEKPPIKIGRYLIQQLRQRQSKQG
jgi:peptidoglycan/LPS O-acetylase OafA/YrhL